MCEFGNPGKTDTKKVVCKQALPHSTAAGAATLSCSPWVTAASNMLHNSATGDYGKKTLQRDRKKKKKRAGQDSSYPYKSLINTLRTFAKHLGSPNRCNGFVYQLVPFNPLFKSSYVLAPKLCLVAISFIDSGREQIVSFIRNEFTTF